MTDDPTLAAMRAAAEHVRAANHTAPHAPRDVAALYARAGELHALLCQVGQLARGLAVHVEAALVEDPPAGLYSDDDTDPAVHAAAAETHLAAAGSALHGAITSVDRAWSALSHLGERPADDDGRGGR